MTDSFRCPSFSHFISKDGGSLPPELVRGERCSKPPTRRQPLCNPARLARSLATRWAPVPLLAPRQPASGCHPPPPSRQRLAGPGQRPRALCPGLALPPPRAPRGADPGSGGGAKGGRGLDLRGAPPRPTPPRSPSKLLCAVPEPIDTRRIAGVGMGEVGGGSQLAGPSAPVPSSDSSAPRV